VRWTLRHPTEPDLARHSHDPRRGGIYVEVDDDGTRLITLRHATPSGRSATCSVVITFGLLGGAEVDAALDWIQTPEQWRRGRPTDRGARRVLEIMEWLRMTPGE
jgi:hypothetical protein